MQLKRNESSSCIIIMIIIIMWFHHDFHPFINFPRRNEK